MIPEFCGVNYLTFTKDVIKKYRSLRESLLEYIVKPCFVLIFFIAATSLILQTSCTSLNTEAECLKSGKEHYEKEQYDKAIRDYTRAIELKPDSAKTYKNRGTAFYKLKQYDKAIQDYSKSIELKSDEYNYLLRGIAYGKLEQYDKAIQDYSKSIELKPDENYYLLRGAAYDKLKQYDKAVLDYAKAIELKPDENYYLLRGNAYFHMKQYDKTVQDCSRSIELKPGERKYLLRGIAYFEQKQYDKAITDFSKNIELNRYCKNAYQCRGATYCRLRQYDKAIFDRSKAIELKPDDIASYTCILEICIITGQPEQFNKWLKQFAAIPESKLSKAALLIKLYLVCLNKCILNEPRTEMENRLEALLKEKIELDWSFELTDEWLDNPKNGLTPEQIKYIRELSDKVKASQKNLH